MYWILSIKTLSKTWKMEVGENARRRIESYDEIGERLAHGPKSRRTVTVRESRDECADHRIYLWISRRSRRN